MKTVSTHHFARLNSLFGERFEQLPQSTRVFAAGQYVNLKQVPVLTRAHKKQIDQSALDADIAATISNFHAARAFAAAFERAYM